MKQFFVILLSFLSLQVSLGQSVDYSYDKAGRCIFSQDGVQRTKGRWTYTIPDVFGRTLITGICHNSLYYNESFGGNMPRFAGNISAMTWKADSKNRAFRYGYDRFGRLSSAVYLEEGVANQHYDEHFEYDKMGNVQSINRHGLLDNNQYGTIDSVQIWYIGNQMVHADDAVTGPNYAGAFHFRDSNGYQWDTEYEYDENGRMTKDFNKNILSIQYNLLNLPSRTTFRDGGYINYQYSASGKKQMVSGYAPGQGYKSQFYIGNYVYGNGVKQLLVDGGYVTFSGTTPQYHFYLKDHLGNNRVIVNASGTVEQVNHYYAYGALMGESTGGDVQDFKYNGKELDRLHGLDWFDYGARHYDGVIGSWPTMDPLCEKDYATSPYAYCGNNPMIRVDKDGKIWDTVLDVAFIAYDLADAATQYICDGSVSTTTQAALAADAMAAVIPGVTGAGVATRLGAKTAEIGHGLRNAKAISEGKKYERAELSAAKIRGEKVASQIRLVPKNGIGNIKGNRSNVDQLIKKDNKKYKIVETKLRHDSSKLSKGQKTVKEHVESGNQEFEVRSDNDELEINKGQTIQVDEYEIKYKH